MDINMSVKCSCLSHAIATYTLLKSGMSLYFMTTYTHLSFPEPLIKHHHSFSEVNSLILIGYWRNPYNSPLRHILWHQSLLIIRVLHICLSCWPFNCSPNSITLTHTHTLLDSLTNCLHDRVRLKLIHTAHNMVHSRICNKLTVP